LLAMVVSTCEPTNLATCVTPGVSVPGVSVPSDRKVSAARCS
jgi:hypothetical protein